MENNKPLTTEESNLMPAGGRGNNRILIVSIIALVCIVGIICGIFAQSGLFRHKLTDEDRISQFLDAYINADIETVESYLEQDNMLWYMLKGVNAEITQSNQSALTRLYNAAYMAGSNITYSVAEMENSDAEGSVQVTITNIDLEYICKKALQTELVATIQTEDGFANVIDAMTYAIDNQTDAISFTKSFEVKLYVDDDTTVLTTNDNREFLRALTGYFYDYIDVNTTKLSNQDLLCSYELLACGDEVEAFIYEVYEAFDEEFKEEYAEFVLADYQKLYENIDGIIVLTQKEDEGIRVKYGIDCSLIEKEVLHKLGFVNDVIDDKNNGYISVKATVDQLVEYGFD